MFGRKAARARIAALEAELEEVRATRNKAVECAARFRQREHAATSETRRLEAQLARNTFADSVQDVLAAFGPDGATNELALREALDELRDDKLVALNVRVQVMAARLNDAVRVRGSAPPPPAPTPGLGRPETKGGE